MVVEMLRTGRRISIFMSTNVMDAIDRNVVQFLPLPSAWAEILNMCHTVDARLI
jgi:hypothetical protein